MQDLQIFNLLNSEVGSKTTIKPICITDVFRSAFFSLLFIEIEKILTMYAYSNTYKGVYQINFGSFEISYHPLLKSPFCPCCGYVARSPRCMTIDRDGVLC